MRIGVLGAGTWGMALSRMLSNTGHEVTVWSALPAEIEELNSTRRQKNRNDMKIAWNDDIKKRIAEQTKVMGSQIIKAKGRTHYGIATCVCQLSDVIINMRPTIASVSSVLLGEHGCRDVALSVPSVIGSSGVQQRIREKWVPEEYRGFFDAVEKVRTTIKMG